MSDDSDTDPQSGQALAMYQLLFNQAHPQMGTSSTSRAAGAATSMAMALMRAKMLQRLQQQNAPAGWGAGPKASALPSNMSFSQYQQALDAPEMQ